MKRWWLSGFMVASFAAFVAGCATSGGFDAGRDTPIEAGARFVVLERLPRAGEDARVFVQQGRVIRFQDRDRFAPWCGIALRRIGDEPLAEAVEPGRFTIDAVEPGIRSGAASRAPLRVAARRLAIGMLDRGGAGLGYLTWYVEMRLQSVEQPQVHDLTCAVDRSPDWRGSVGLESARRALGGLARLEPATR